MTAHSAFVATGGTLDLIGIALVASPELFPHVSRVYGASRRRALRIASHVRRLLRRPSEAHVFRPSSGGIRLSGGSAVLVKSVSPAADLDRKVEALVGIVEELQQRLGNLENSVHILPDTWRADIADLRSKLEAYVQSESERMREAHLGKRLTGIACLFLGSSLLSVASLV
jgi:ABC-type ATPase with predicted acetyltransferase domain